MSVTLHPPLSFLSCQCPDKFHRPSGDGVDPRNESSNRSAVIHGLRGCLHVTFEEETCAVWLHDLLKPHATKVVACDPRKNTLLKAGNKSERIDARERTELLRSGNLLRSLYHGEHGLRTLKELARSYLTTSKDLGRVMSRPEGDLPKLGNSLYWETGLCAALSLGVARQDPRSRCVASGRVPLPTTRRICGLCARKYAANYQRKAESTARRNCYAGFHRSAP